MMPLFACFLRWYRCVPCTDALCQRIGRVRAIYFSFCACISTSVSAFVSVWFAPGIQQVRRCAASQERRGRNRNVCRNKTHSR